MVSMYNLILCLLLNFPPDVLGQEMACEGRSCAEVQGDGNVLLQAKLAVALEDGEKTQKQQTPHDEIQDDEEDENIVDMINRENDKIATEVIENMTSNAFMLIAKGGSMIHDMVHAAADEEDSTQDSRRRKKGKGKGKGKKSKMRLPFTVPFDTKKYTNKIELKRKPIGAVAYYKLDADFIHLGLAANAGFVGLGFNPRGPIMRRADIVVCREYKRGTVSAADYYSNKNAQPQLDDVQDWITDTSGRTAAANGRQVTWCEIRRPRLTCEKEEDYQVYADTTSLFALLAFSAPNAKTDQFSYHGIHQRKGFAFQFQASAVAGAQADKKMTVTAPGVKVPVVPGSYIWSYHILPIDVNIEYHITKFKATLGSATRHGVAHHIDMNVCSRPVPRARSNTIVKHEVAMKFCGEVLLSGAAQYSPLGDSMPSDAGIPIGKGAAIYVSLSRHFYNPSRKSGIRDRNAKYQIWYTATLRPNNFMVLILTTNQIRIPALSSESVHEAQCPSNCMSRLKGTTEVRHVGFHVHGKGLRTVLRILRDGQELEPIAQVDPWDEALSTVVVSRTLVPGDDLKLECVYQNPENRIVPYGDELTNEMCVAHVKVVGPGSMKMCADRPWGQLKPPPSCYYTARRRRQRGIRKIRPWPVCDTKRPSTFCPDANNAVGIRRARPALVDPSARGFDQHFVKYVPDTGKCNKAGAGKVLVPAIAGSCVAPAIENTTVGSSQRIPEGAGDRSDESRADLTARAAQPGQIVGGADCGTGNRAFKVSWAANCNDSTITFELEVKGNPGWIALGLLDGGAADAPLKLPGLRMRALDIVQAKPSASILKDGTGLGYVPPKRKSKAVASYVSGGSRHGKSYVKFVRPFISPDGLSLTEEGFVYMVCAARFNTANFKSKHTIATYIPTRISLFGGIPESYKDGVPLTKGGGSIAPQTNVPKTKDWEIRTSGRCDETQGQPSSLAGCWALAGNAGVHFTSSKDFSGAVHSKKRPKGCFLQKKLKRLGFNKDGRSDCSETFVCVCKSRKKAEPEPEPEPSTAKSEPEPEPTTTKPEPKVAFAIDSGPNCPPTERVVQKSDCEVKAKELGITYTRFKSMRMKKKWPVGCFVRARGRKGRRKLYFNTNQDSVATCDHTKVRCICARPKPKASEGKATSFVQTGVRDDYHDYEKNGAEEIYTQEPDGESFAAEDEGDAGMKDEDLGMEQIVEEGDAALDQTRTSDDDADADDDENDFETNAESSESVDADNNQEEADADELDEDTEEVSEDEDEP